MRGLLIFILGLTLPPATALAATRYVSNAGVDNATCAQPSPCASIQHAITIANAGDTIDVGKGTFKESFGVSIDKNLTINGAGAFSTTVSTVWNATVFTIELGVTATITGVFVRHGHGQQGGGVDNEGTLMLERVRIWQNEAISGGGGIFNASNAVLTVRNSEIAYNKSINAGGGIHNQGTAILENVRVVANSAASAGGISTSHDAVLTITQSLVAVNDPIGISSFGTVLTLVNTTVSRNRRYGIGTGDRGRTRLTHVTVAENGMGAKGAAGLLVEQGSELFLLNTIVANNDGSQCDVRGGPETVVSGSGSLDSDNSCRLFPPPYNLIDVDPQLGPLKSNGGTSQTHALKPGSPAIDHATSEFCEAVDQRGINRPVDGDFDNEAICDIGAYEFVPVQIER